MANKVLRKSGSSQEQEGTKNDFMPVYLPTTNIITLKSNIILTYSKKPAKSYVSNLLHRADSDRRFGGKLALHVWLERKIQVVAVCDC